MRFLQKISAYQHADETIHLREAIRGEGFDIYYIETCFSGIALRGFGHRSRTFHAEVKTRQNRDSTGAV